MTCVKPQHKRRCASSVKRMGAIIRGAKEPRIKERPAVNRGFLDFWPLPLATKLLPTDGGYQRARMTATPATNIMCEQTATCHTGNYVGSFWEIRALVRSAPTDIAICHLYRITNAPMQRRCARMTATVVPIRIALAKPEHMCYNLGVIEQLFGIIS